MRPVIVDFLDDKFNTQVFSWIVPDLAFIYAAAIGTCMIVFVRRAKDAGLSEYHSWGAAIFAGSAGILGVRIWYLLMNPGAVLAKPGMITMLNGPTVSFGGYFFGGAAFVIYLFAGRENPLRYLDAAGSCLGLGPMIARWSCFLNGDDYGTLTNVAWGVRYPPGSFPFADQVNRGLINISSSQSLPVHPVQIYLSINGLVLFLICSWLYKRTKLPLGVLFGLYWLFYSILRFAAEFYRGDPSAHYWHALSYGQLVCGVIFVASVVYIVVLHRKPRGMVYRTVD